MNLDQTELDRLLALPAGLELDAAIDRFALEQEPFGWVGKNFYDGVPSTEIGGVFDRLPEAEELARACGGDARVVLRGRREYSTDDTRVVNLLSRTETPDGGAVYALSTNRVSTDLPSLSATVANRRRRNIEAAPPIDGCDAAGDAGDHPFDRHR
jgi:hypothetical protein